MYPRRPHTKSRNGCGQCKRAHIKCDLQAPLCSQCAKKKRTCDYQPRFSTHSSPTPQSEKALVQTPAVKHHIPQLPVSPIALLSLFDYEVQIWESGFRQVHDQQFVQHGILAISALYADAYRQDSHSPVSKNALFHQLEASRLFRLTISAVTKDNWPSVLVFAVALIVFHFSIISKAPDECILQTMLLLRNSAPLGLEIGNWLDQSGLKALLSAKQKEYKTPLSLDEVKEPFEAIEALENHILLSYNKGVTSLAYQQALSALKKWLSWTEGRPLAWIHFVWWPASITPEYMTLLAENEDGALLIFIHWCAIMKNAPQKWYFQGWAETVGASAFHRIRSPECNISLKWATTTLGIDFSWIRDDMKAIHRLRRGGKQAQSMSPQLLQLLGSQNIQKFLAYHRTSFRLIFEALVQQDIHVDDLTALLNCSNLKSDYEPLGRILILEDLSKIIIKLLEAGPDIDPLFFARDISGLDMIAEQLKMDAVTSFVKGRSTPDLDRKNI